MKFLAIGVIGFMVLTIWSRFVSEKGMAALSNEQKGALVSRFAAMRKFSVLILAAIILVFLLLAYYTQLDKMTGMFLYFGAFVIYIITTTFMGLAVAKKMGLPEAYFKPTRMAGVLRVLGLIILIVCMAIFLSGYANQAEVTF